MTYSAGTQATQHLPDALIVGAPKAGTTALHAALARHPQVHASPVKEPKFYMCGEAPPPAFCGPGDAHSQQEWIWRRDDYEKLFTDAPKGQVRLESTPFYLCSAEARRRISEELPDVKLIAVIRDRIDGAYSNWMHLWVDGLEPEADFVTACHAESKRIAAGWAPFWHYRQLGRYGEQLEDLTRRCDRERILVFRYRDLVSTPAQTLARVADFLRIDPSAVTSNRPTTRDGSSVVDLRHGSPVGQSPPAPGSGSTPHSISGDTPAVLCWPRDGSVDSASARAEH